MERPNVVFGRRASEGMFRGAEKLGRLLSLTLGPVKGHIVLARDMGSSDRYEAIADAATIARRIIALPEPTEDVGAMLLRQLVWRVRQKAGDGSATAAVLALAIMREARRCIVAGANAMRLREGVELGARAAVKALQKMAQPLEGQERLAALAAGVCGDAAMGKIIGEIFDTLGPEGIVTVQDYVGFYLDREYIEGSRFKGKFTSRFFLTDTNYKLVQLVRPYIFISEWNLSETAKVQPLLELMLREGEGRPLLVLSASQDGDALSALLANHQRGVLQCCGATLSGVGDPMRAALDDLALVTGGRFLYRDGQLNPSDVRLSDLGQAARVEVSEDFVTVFEGAGDRKAIRKRVQMLRSLLPEAKDAEEANDIRQRLGRLGGGIAILKVGAPTDKERERLRQQAEEAVNVVAGAYQGGVVAGGGAAYLACIPAVKAVQAEGDVAIGVAILARALEEPMRCLSANAGMDPSVAVARCQREGQGYGVDVRSGEVVDMQRAGIMDSVRVLQTALESAVSGASMLFTTGAIFLHRKPELSVEP